MIDDEDISNIFLVDECIIRLRIFLHLKKRMGVFHSTIIPISTCSTFLHLFECKSLWPMFKKHRSIHAFIFVKKVIVVYIYAVMLYYFCV